MNVRQQLGQGLLVMVTLMLLSGAGWNAAINGRSYWSLVFGVLFLVLASTIRNISDPRTARCRVPSDDRSSTPT